MIALGCLLFFCYWPVQLHVELLVGQSLLGTGALACDAYHANWDSLSAVSRARVSMLY